MSANAPVHQLRVRLALALAPRAAVEVELLVPAGSTVADAVRLSGLLHGIDNTTVDSLQTGIWGRRVVPLEPLRDGDRVELYRSLKVDPKMARRERFARQGARGTGLFSKRRAGAKSGY